MFSGLSKYKKWLDDPALEFKKKYFDYRHANKKPHDMLLKIDDFKLLTRSDSALTKPI